MSSKSSIMRRFGVCELCGDVFVLQNLLTIEDGPNEGSKACRLCFDLNRGLAIINEEIGDNSDDN